jgi:hypothetical protein
MAKPPPNTPKLPPPTAAECWRTFALWVLGIPLLVAGALGFVWVAFRATGSLGMSWQLESNTATVLLGLAAIVLLYPAMLWVWWGDLQSGLKAARDWEAMTPDARAAAIAEAAAGVAAPKRRTRKKG